MALHTTAASSSPIHTSQGLESSRAFSPPTNLSALLAFYTNTGERHSPSEQEPVQGNKLASLRRVIKSISLIAKLPVAAEADGNQRREGRGEKLPLVDLGDLVKTV